MASNEKQSIMSEEEKIELSKESEKTESRQEEVNENNSQGAPHETNQPETQNLQLQTENMEVHHHPKVEKKNFREYLLEGLMIFIAVTLGFFAEGLRETINDDAKETEYINSLINNLKKDTASLNSTILENQRKEKGLDSLILLSFKNTSDRVNRQNLYRYSSKYVSFYSVFISDDATMMQLKNSGGLRYIKRDHIADSIAQYDLQVRSVYAAEVPYLTASSNAVDMVQDLMISTWYQDTMYFKNDSFTGKQLPLVDDDPKKLRIFFNKISYEKGWTQNYVQNLSNTLPKTIRLIELLKKEYNLP
jgi:hypothetical protein